MSQYFSWMLQNLTLQCFINVAMFHCFRCSRFLFSPSDVSSLALLYCKWLNNCRWQSRILAGHCKWLNNAKDSQCDGDYKDNYGIILCNFFCANNLSSRESLKMDYSCKTNTWYFLNLSHGRILPVSGIDGN